MFGEECLYFARALYYMLSKGYERINIKTLEFMHAMKDVLVRHAHDSVQSKSYVDLQNFAYHFYDFNRQGGPSIIGLLQAQAYVPCNTRFGEELETLRNAYVQEFIIPKGVRQIELIPLKTMTEAVPQSCVIDVRLCQLLCIGAAA